MEHVSQSGGSSGRILFASAFLLVLIPPVVFCLHGLVGGLGLMGTMDALLDQYTAARANLVYVTLLGLLPLLLLVLLLWIRQIVWKSRNDAEVYAIGALLPVLAVSLFSNHEYWSDFLPERRFPGFPHGLEFVIGAFVFAPIGILLGLTVAWLLLKNSGKP